jgi:hypothetical protein
VQRLDKGHQSKPTLWSGGLIDFSLRMTEAVIRQGGNWNRSHGHVARVTGPGKNKRPHFYLPSMLALLREIAQGVPLDES